MPVNLIEIVCSAAFHFYFVYCAAKDIAHKSRSNSTLSVRRIIFIYVICLRTWIRGFSAPAFKQKPKEIVNCFDRSVSSAQLFDLLNLHHNNVSGVLTLCNASFHFSIEQCQLLIVIQAKFSRHQFVLIQ